MNTEFKRTTTVGYKKYIAAEKGENEYADIIIDL